ncbi:hypothetical protein ACNOYE_20890 [Nannocystaceae bacterium ST9]
MRLARAARIVAVPLIAALILAPAIAGAAPVEGLGTSKVDPEAAARSRDRAVTAARKAALEQAIAGITDVSVDPDAVAQVLDRAETWTAAYRILEVAEQDGAMQARVEVDIDVPRLRKRIAVRDATTRPKGFAWGGVSASGCGEVEDARLEDPLRAYGIVADQSKTTLTLALTCSDRGAVSHTHVRAAEVTISAKLAGELELSRTVEARAFSEDGDEAIASAIDRALGELAEQLAVHARGDLELRVEQPWPAARVRRLELTLRESVMGVDSAELAGIMADGAAVLRVQGKIDVNTLGQRMQTLAFPDFRLVGLRIDATHALRARME